MTNCPKCGAEALMIGRDMATGVDQEICGECDYERPLAEAVGLGENEVNFEVTEISIAGIVIKPMFGMLGSATGSIERYFEIEGKKVSMSSARRLARVLTTLIERHDDRLDP